MNYSSAFLALLLLPLSAGAVGRKGTGRELWSNNSAELAIIPIQQLRLEP